MDWASGCATAAACSRSMSTRSTSSSGRSGRSPWFPLSADHRSFAVQSIDKVVFVFVVQVVQVSPVQVVEKTGGSHSCSLSKDRYDPPCHGQSCCMPALLGSTADTNLRQFPEIFTSFSVKTWITVPQVVSRPVLFVLLLGSTVNTSLCVRLRGWSTTFLLLHFHVAITGEALDKIVVPVVCHDNSLVQSFMAVQSRTRLS